MDSFDLSATHDRVSLHASTGEKLGAAWVPQLRSPPLVLEVGARFFSWHAESMQYRECYVCRAQPVMDSFAPPTSGITE
jgi:hypothetical protein